MSNPVLSNGAIGLLVVGEIDRCFKNTEEVVLKSVTELAGGSS